MLYPTEVTVQLMAQDGKPVIKAELLFLSWQDLSNGFLTSNRLLSQDTLITDAQGEVILRKDLPYRSYVTLSVGNLPEYNITSIPNEFWKQTIPCGTKKSLQFVVSK